MYFYYTYQQALLISYLWLTVSVSFWDLFDGVPDVESSHSGSFIEEVPDVEGLDSGSSIGVDGGDFILYFSENFNHLSCLKYFILFF